MLHCLNFLYIFLWFFIYKISLHTKCTLTVFTSL
nr:MAG TPA: hypothetical protein [Caudoviricetes sp.]DAY04839.1 MAG TPA: hypothetical protein [Caudoviricetes sp.]